MRYGLFDLLFMIACISVGMLGGLNLASEFSKRVQLVAGISSALFVYLGLVYPFYRGLRLRPMILPRCPCCRTGRDNSFEIIGGPWPRITLRCCKCNGEFVIWLNGKPGDQETWEKPVLALKWPYAWGIYKRENNPDRNAAADGVHATRLCNSEGIPGPSAGGVKKRAPTHLLVLNVCLILSAIGAQIQFRAMQRKWGGMGLVIGFASAGFLLFRLRSFLGLMNRYYGSQETNGESDDDQSPTPDDSQ
jgi:hypothetical protein